MMFIRIIGTWIFIIFMSIVILTCLPLIFLHKPMRLLGIPNKYHPYDIIHYMITQGSLFFAGCTVEVHYAECFDSKSRYPLSKVYESFPSYYVYTCHKSYIVCSNHTSNLDIPALYKTGLSLKFIMKKELLKLYPPVFYPAKWTDHICIDRSNTEDSIKQLKFAGEQMIEKNYSTVVFPEGTRNKTDELFLPFKSGAFHMAVETDIPILPIAIIGPKKYWNANCWWGNPCVIHLYVLKPVVRQSLRQLAEKVNPKTKDDLLNETRSALSEALTKNKPDCSRNEFISTLPSLILVSTVGYFLTFFI